MKSIRVINELDTWIFKGETGRMDHMAGSHDDTITCLAMALFVMQFSFNKLEATKHKDAAMLKAYMTGRSYNERKSTYKEGENVRPKYNMPFHNANTMKNSSSNVQGSYLWLFSGYH